MVPFSESYNTRLLSSVISNTHTQVPMPQPFALLRRLSSEQPLTCTVDFNFHSLKKKKAQVEKEQKKMGFLLDNYKKLQKKTEDRQKQEK